MLADRVKAAEREQQRRADEMLRDPPAYGVTVTSIKTALTEAEQPQMALVAAQTHALGRLSDFGPPALAIPEADLDCDAPCPLFRSDDYAANTAGKLVAHKAIAHKALEEVGYA